MNYLLPIMQSHSEYITLKSKLSTAKTPTAVVGCLHIHKVHLAATIMQDFNKKGFILTADDGEALRIIEDFAAFGVNALHYPLRDWTFRSMDSTSHEYEQQRLSTLCNIIDGKFDVIVCSADAAMQYTIPKNILQDKCFKLNIKQSITGTKIAENLLLAGYTKWPQVEGKGQFSARGGILDIYPPDAELPLRIEFWGDEIDTISTFDIETQRRLDTIKQCVISPAREVLCDTHELCEKLENFAENLTKKNNQQVKQNICIDIDKLKSGLHLGSYDKYLSLIYSPATIFNYLSDYMLFVSESSKIKERVKNYLWQHNEDIKTCFEDGLLTSGIENYTLTYEDVCRQCELNSAIFLDQFGRATYETDIGYMINFNLRQLSQWSGAMDILVEDLSASLQSKMACIVMAGSERAAQLLAQDLYDAKLPAIYAKNPGTFRKSQVTVIQGGISHGFEYATNGYLVITQGRGAVLKKARKRVQHKGGHIASLEELRRGDYVVHASHGIGIFDGIEAKQIDNITKDYIKIKYQKEDTLYVPVTQLDLITKYIGSKEEGTLKLHRLGGTEWQKARSKVRSAVKEMAAQLIELYSKRMKAQGYAFSDDNDMQNDFERRFEFDETEDQLRCVDEIKTDMKKSNPMDRLLCGDVGFGKTEVALRAAFKAVLDGKQVAILVPTTILAWQHFQTLHKRFEGMPVEFELLSRFRTPKQQEDILKRLKSGQVDIVVGTHRLVSKDVKFRDLGLLIVDEEQRFGVAQKEKIKEAFPSIDVLTLSATPIPRTLNMAMSGLRDMSLIEEAPQDRHPVQTYVLEHDNGIIIDSIKKELRRGGQVFYLVNRIDSVERIAISIQSKIDDSRVAFAHGRMAEEELSGIWKRLVEGEIDVLVCTTIIETGVDVPNCNTIIIQDSDKMGLSQLHQLRGRVGRSARRAYAYLTFKRGKALSDIATKRLEAIREYTEFGAGFKIAMRDLEIRGAGNILGGEQHGHMDAVGYDLYLRMLSDAIKVEKGETPVMDVECTVDLPVEAHIPESYINSVPQRLQMYRRIADIRTEDDSFDVYDELIDRYGEPPNSVKGLVDVALLRNRAAAKSIYEISYTSGQVLMYLRHLNMEQISPLINSLRGRVMVGAGNKPYLALRVSPKQEPVDALREIMDVWI